MMEIDVEQVKKVIDKIRPYLQYDGGDIEFVKVEDGFVYVSMHGACADCLSLDVTLAEGVEALLLDEVPGIQGVKLFNE